MDEPKFHCDDCDRDFESNDALNMHNSTKHSLNARKLEKDETGKSKSSSKWIFGAIIVLAIIGFVFFHSSSNTTPGKYDSFARCITDSGAKMFGAYWCPHCKDQKEMFGDSWSKINYIECSLPNNAGQTQICIAEGIDGYPTWEFGDGSRESGTLSFDELSIKTGCALNST